MQSQSRSQLRSQQAQQARSQQAQSQPESSSGAHLSRRDRRRELLASLALERAAVLGVVVVDAAFIAAELTKNDSWDLDTAFEPRFKGGQGSPLLLSCYCSVCVATAPTSALVALAQTPAATVAGPFAAVRCCGQDSRRWVRLDSCLRAAAAAASDGRWG